MIGERLADSTSNLSFIRNVERLEVNFLAKGLIILNICFLGRNLKDLNQNCRFNAVLSAWRTQQGGESVHQKGSGCDFRYNLP